MIIHSVHSELEWLPCEFLLFLLVLETPIIYNVHAGSENGCVHALNFLELVRGLLWQAKRAWRGKRVRAFVGI